MIERLNKKSLMDIIVFLNKTPDLYNDFYITINKERIFLKENRSLILKLLKYHQVFGVYENELKSLMVIYSEKGFRKYVKLLSVNNEYYRRLLKFLMWNFSEVELYCKLKKSNYLSTICQKSGFIFIGNRGLEILLIKKAFKILHRLIPKDLKEN